MQRVHCSVSTQLILNPVLKQASIILSSTWVVNLVFKKKLKTINLFVLFIADIITVIQSEAKNLTEFHSQSNLYFSLGLYYNETYIGISFRTLSQWQQRETETVKSF